MSTRKLLILDLDETLVHSTEEPLDRPADLRVERFHVYFRPCLMEFLEACGADFELSVWSSSTTAYTQAITEAIFPQPGALAFVWGRERCTPGLDGEGEACWLKSLRKVTRRGYWAGSVVAVDDSPEKWARSYGNLVSVRPFLGDRADDELRHLAVYLHQIRRWDDVRAAEKRFWRAAM